MNDKVESGAIDPDVAASEQRHRGLWRTALWVGLVVALSGWAACDALAGRAITLADAALALAPVLVVLVVRALAKARRGARRSNAVELAGQPQYCGATVRPRV
jgi:hypothetical protein